MMYGTFAADEERRSAAAPAAANGDDGGGKDGRQGASSPLPSSLDTLDEPQPKISREAALTGLSNV